MGDDTYHESLILDEAYGPVLHLSGGVGFGMDIADLLHFERAFHGSGVVNPTTKEECVPDMGELRGEPLDTLLLLQYLLYL